MPCLHPIMSIGVRQESYDIYIYIYSLRCRLGVSFNLITHSVINSDFETKQSMDCDFI